MTYTNAAALLLTVTLAACAHPRSRLDASAGPGPSRALVAACRHDVDRAYNAQNRADLSRRDQRDSPFSDNYVSGITSRGLSAAYGRDADVATCIRENEIGTAGATPKVTSTGPTFTPVGK